MFLTVNGLFTMRKWALFGVKVGGFRVVNHRLLCAVPTAWLILIDSACDLTFCEYVTNIIYLDKFILFGAQFALYLHEEK